MAAPEISTTAASPALRLEAARAIGCTTQCLDNETGYLWRIERGGVSRLLYGGISPLNDALAAAVATDKFHTATALADAGFRVPTRARCLRPGRFRPGAYASHTGLDAGLALAERIGFPLIVKPAHGARGRSVAAVASADALAAAVEAVWREDHLALVEAPVPGVDLRVDLLDGTCLIGYLRRLSAGVEAGRRRAADLVLNLNRGADADVVDLSAPWLDRSRAVAAALGLRHCGIDFKIAGLASDPAGATVIEVNASPSMEQIARRGHHARALAGEKRVVEAILALG